MGQTQRLITAIAAVLSAAVLTSCVSTDPATAQGQQRPVTCAQQQQNLIANQGLSEQTSQQLYAADCYAASLDILQQLEQQASDSDDLATTERLRLTLAERFANGTHEQQAEPDYQQALQWYQAAAALPSLDALELLIQWHHPDNDSSPLPDDNRSYEQVVRYGVALQQAQQRFGQRPTALTETAKLQHLYVISRRATVFADANDNANVITNVARDQQLGLLDVVLVEAAATNDGTEQYWVEVYLYDEQQVGWIAADQVDELTVAAREVSEQVLEARMADIIQPTLIASILGSSDTSALNPVRDDDFFNADQHLRHNVLAVMNAVNQRAAQCEVERAQMIDDFHQYLLADDRSHEPKSTFHHYPNMAWLNRVMSVYQPPQGGSAIYQQTMRDLQQLLTIRHSGRDQRLCHSLPNAAGVAGEVGEQFCQQMSALSECVGQMRIIHSYMEPTAAAWYRRYGGGRMPPISYPEENRLILRP